MTTLFARRALLSSGWAENVRVTIEKGRIERLETACAREAADDSVGVLLPGMANAHSHAFQRALLGRTEYRSAATRDTFWTWRDAMYRLAASLSPSDLFSVARQLYTEMLVSGYTGVAEFHYLHGKGTAHGPDVMRDALHEAACAAGIRWLYLPVYYEQADFDGMPLTDEQQQFGLGLDEFLAHVEQSARVVSAPNAIGVAAHSLRAVSPASLDVVAGRAADMGVPMHIHIAEQPLEVDGAVAALGARPVRWLLDNVAVDRRWTLVHATHMDRAEAAALADSGAAVCLCPSTEGNLGDGVFSLDTYLQAGGAIAIGSDSHVSVNPFEELRWLEYGQRLITQSRNVAAIGGVHTGAELWRRSVAGGAQANGVGAGSLAEGAPADLLAVDDGAPMLAGLDGDRLLDALVFGGLPSPVEGVMVNGAWCVHDGVHRIANEAAENFAAVMERLGFHAEASQ